ncbi:MAG: histidine kinase, partial [Clostridia bacterium]|nr:histidine kinase [Clostridia bacterium]
ILIPLLILVFGLTPVVARDSYLSKQQKRIMTGIIGLITVLIAQNVFDHVLQTDISMPYIRTLESIVGYSVRPVIIVLFCKLVKPKSRNTIAWILVIYNAAVYLTATFSRLAFYIDENNHFQGGFLYFGKTVFVVSFILLFYLLYCTIKEYRGKKTWIWIPIANIVLVIAAALMDISPLYRNYPVSYLTIAIVCCSLFYYIWLHLEFVKSHEKALMAEQRIKLMMSQIQPHFLYNSLSSISELCETDPQKAQQLTDDFSEYLRFNLSALNTEKLISFDMQLEQTEVYLKIEKTRFGDRVNAVYEIEARDFEVPTLTVQPLVENAVRHGICKRQGGGTVTIRSYETDIEYVIEIVDNGVGFDTESIANDGGTHVGIENVRERLAYFGDTLEIKSEINKGTTAVIRVPKKRSKG